MSINYAICNKNIYNADFYGKYDKLNIGLWFKHHEAVKKDDDVAVS